MKHISALVVTLFAASWVSAQDSTGTVVDVKRELQAQGAKLNGSCGAFAITNAVAHRLGLKLLRKTIGTRAVPLADGSCLTNEETTDPEGYADGYLIMLPSGVGVDLLEDAGGKNRPKWDLESAADMVARNLQSWRDPVRLRTTTDDDTTTDSPDVLVQLSTIQNELLIIKTEGRATRAVADEAVKEIKAHREGVSKVWTRVAAIAGPIVTGLVTWVTARR
jgi:predicted double-glycine peptidase